MNKVLLFFAIKYNGDWDAIYRALDRKEHINFEDLDKAERELPCHYLTILDANYPIYLKNIYKPPFVLFYYGDLELFKRSYRLVTVYGCGEMDDSIKLKTEEIVLEISTQNKTILSDLDTECNKIAVKKLLAINASLVVLCSNGIDQIDLNIDPYKNLIASGLVLSEFYRSLPSTDKREEAKNRILIGAGKGIFIPRSDHGFKINNLFNLACNEGRDVFCLPDQVNRSNNNNYFIKQGAKLVESASDILDDV